jgi:putative N6-adenine-specific DNA methylase
VVARLVHDRLTLSVDAAGEHLHRRGWRLATAKAPLREHLAAAVVLASGWDAATPFVDPCCGSGTLAIEAALLARSMAPGLTRSFAAERWPSLPPGTFEVARARAAAAVRTPAAPIFASDHLDGAVRAAAANAERAGVADLVEVRRQDVADLRPPAGPGALVTNPPYGMRVGPGRDLTELYRTIGGVARARLPGWLVAVLTVPGPLGPATGLPVAPVLTTTTGGTRVTLLAGRVPAGRVHSEQ